MYTPDEIKQILIDYSWMLNTVESNILASDSTGTSQCGIEAVMPKTKGVTSDKVSKIVLRTLKQDNFTIKCAEKIKFIDDNEHHITKAKDVYILKLLKLGYSYTKIGLLAQLHKSQVANRVDVICGILSEISKQSTNSTN
ncbi:hypothetical protein KYJ98_02335 [Mammaliicoccus lentus]|uniref:hypothetical protein n=1 Tax=Mammaliicoccus lentus TaxID=42858 RepID=UPI001C4DF2D1|nr:hypothetical protein [Mammaliicoccus lentus]MBW0769178.1 hypothetical protein [Mammaliicoccus lentus]